MPQHTVTVSVPMPIHIEKSDSIVDVFSDGKRLGKLHISQGSIDWKAAGKSTRVKHYSWEQFAALMENGKKTEKRISKAAPKKKTVRKKSTPV
ncbi:MULTISPECIES: hypothetical protein [Achromobacter]|uniref:Uncharacterized protein n=1 Tax=Achromobacter spanius TaxID=217203 RepID=A0ABY8GVA6_9BURK|nr:MULTISPECIES: hypothetical protein [Achromobacter]WAI82294.1 hypothetical protein N8Z00_22590 [Achromobacter spanius]WEX92381.1 hypothetical protein N3Z32_17195 [Achromobacter sp. SS2-2022]WFP08468.1 hypothetical protein P8T11_00935 [Achromobacter spanius]